MTMKSLILPALRAAMGDWVYYVTTMPMAEVAKRVRAAKEIHKSNALKELIQRSLSDRAGDIATYLLKQRQHFFNAIIVGIYDGAPEWFGIAVSGNNAVPESEIPETVKSSVGIIRLTGGEKLFAIDGQHRAEGVRQALARSQRLADEEMTVILVAHKTNVDGLQRTRRLFTTLNRYAKAVTPGEIVALDEDHAIAIITRQLLEQHPLLSRRDIVIFTKGKAIPKSNKTCLTSILTLYDSMGTLLEPSKADKTLRPSDAVLKKYYGLAVKYWQLLEDNFAPLKRFAASEETADAFRHNDGGHLLFRPVGQLAISRVVRNAEKQGHPWEWTISRLAQLPMDLAEEPWVGLLWDPVTKRMRVREDRKKLTTSLLQYMIGIDPESFGATEAKLQTQYAGALNKPEAKLPPRISG